MPAIDTSIMPGESSDITKEAPNVGGGKVVRCPNGWFISALQMIRDAGGNAQGGGQRSIKVWFEPFKIENRPEPGRDDEMKTAILVLMLAATSPGIASTSAEAVA